MVLTYTHGFILTSFLISLNITKVPCMIQTKRHRLNTCTMQVNKWPKISDSFYLQHQAENLGEQISSNHNFH